MYVMRRRGGGGGGRGGLDLPTSRAQIFFTSAKRNGRFFMFSAAEANQRANYRNRK